MSREAAYAVSALYMLAFGMGAWFGWMVREWFHYRPVREKIREAEERVANDARAYWTKHIARIKAAKETP